MLGLVKGMHVCVYVWICVIFAFYIYGKVFFFKRLIVLRKGDLNTAE